MQTMTIKNWLTGDTIWEGEADTMLDALRRALAENKSMWRANLGGADLGGADLGGADLRGADLGDANTATARADVRSILTAAPAEVPGLKAALLAGRVDGSVYEGACACLIGTVANVRQVDYGTLAAVNPELRPNNSRPAERWFLAIKEGDTPETNRVVALTLEWIEQWEQDARLVALAYAAKP